MRQLSLSFLFAGGLLGIVIGDIKVVSAILLGLAGWIIMERR